MSDLNIEINDPLQKRIAELEQQLESAEYSNDGLEAENSILKQQNLALMAAIEAKDAAIDNHLNPCGCLDGVQFCKGKISLEEALAIQPSAELLEDRDRVRDAALIRLIANNYDGYEAAYLRIQADKRESGEWIPNLGEN